jgi:hypothetical protein
MSPFSMEKNARQEISIFSFHSKISLQQKLTAKQYTTRTYIRGILPEQYHRHTTTTVSEA